MKDFILIILGLFPKPDPIAESHAETVLASLRILKDGQDALRKRKGDNPSRANIELRFGATAFVEVTRDAATIVLHANPWRKHGYALARRVRRILIRELKGQNVGVSFRLSHK